MARTVRSKAKLGNIAAQIGISSCVLLLPPLAVGAAVYVMLPARDDGTRETAHVTADSQPAAAQRAPQTSPVGTFTVASVRPEQQPTKDPARVMGPVSVHVTVVTAPSATGTQNGAAPAPLPPANAAPAVVAVAPPPAPAVPAVAPAPAPAAMAPIDVATPPPAAAAPSVASAAAVAAAASIVAATPPPAAPADRRASPLTDTDQTGALAPDLPEPHAQAGGRHRFSYIHRLANRGYWRSEARQRRWAARSSNEQPSWLRDILQRLNGRPHTLQRS